MRPPGTPGVLKECISVTRLDHALLRLPDEHFSLGSKLTPPPTLPNRRQQVWGVPTLPQACLHVETELLSLEHRRGGITQVG